VNPDPLGLHEVAKADLNLYAYVKGMALKAVDPLGLEPFDISQPAFLNWSAGDDIGIHGIFQKARSTLAGAGLSTKLFDRAYNGGTLASAPESQGPPGDYRPGSGLLRMKRGDWLKLDQLGKGSFSFEARQGLATLVHESAHAYADQTKFDGSFAFTLSDGRSASALTPGQRRQVFQDAIADYAENRVTAYWHAFSDLTKARNEGTLGQVYGAIRDSYNAQMSIKGGFGYFNENGGSGPIVSESSELPEWARRRVDQDFLGGAVKDRFEDVDAFKQFAPQQSK
jgi:hypothetical protein